MQRHVTQLGAFFIAYGIMGIVGMAVVLGIFRAGHAPVYFDHHHLFDVLHIFGLVIAGIIGFLHLPALIVGWGLMQRCSWARIPGLIVAIIILPALPFGTALGIYGLWVLLKEESARYLSGRQSYRAT